MSFKEVKAKLIKNREFRRGYYETQWDIALIAANALTWARVGKGWSQEKLAQKMGSFQSNIARAEGCKAAPSLHTLNEAAKAMGMVVDIKLTPKKTMKDLSDSNLE